MLKKKFVPVLAVIGVMATIAGGVYAYMTGSEHSGNILQIGKVHTTIEEEFPPPDDSIYKKEARIKNTGDSPCYVRVYVGFSDDQAFDLSGVGESKDGPWYSINTDPENAKIQDQTFSKTYAEYLTESGSAWIYVPMQGESFWASDAYTEGQKSLLGGWYYYKEKLEPGESTKPLLGYINTLLPKEEMDYEVILYQEAVQDRDKDGELFDPAVGEVWLQAWSEFISSIPSA